MNTKEKISYYILFENYTQGLLLQDYLREEHIASRIAPAPRSIQGKLGCGMALLIQPEEIERVRDCILRRQAEYYDIVPLVCQINPNRDKYC